jgi:hypothetical protein
MFRKKNKPRKQPTKDCVAFEESDGDATLRLSGELGYFTVPLLEDMLRGSLASYGDTSFELDLMRWGRLLTQVSPASSSRRDGSRPK